MTSGHPDTQPWVSGCTDVKNRNPVWHRMLLYSCTHMATVGVKGLSLSTTWSLLILVWVLRCFVCSLQFPRLRQFHEPVVVRIGQFLNHQHHHNCRFQLSLKPYMKSLRFRIIVTDYSYSTRAVVYYLLYKLYTNDELEKKWNIKIHMPNIHLGA